MSRELLHQANIKRYLAEGRTVSGGDGNGPGKPGYQVITLGDLDENATKQLNDAQAAGYELLFAVPFDQGNGITSTRVILANYKKDS